MDPTHPRALIVEDDASVAQTLALIVERMGFVPTGATCATDAFRAWPRRSLDLVLLDLELPDGNGRDILAKVGQAGLAPGVIVVSATTNHQTRAALLRLGADDYVCKPFEVDDLSARVVAVMRRRQPQLEFSCLGGLLTLRPARRLVTSQWGQAELTPIQFGIVWVLATYRHQSIPIRDLCAYVLGGMSDRHVSDCRAHITRTRRALNQLGAGVGIRCTMHEGYTLVAHADHVPESIVIL